MSNLWPLVDNWKSVLKNETIQSVRAVDAGKPGVTIRLTLKSGNVWIITPLDGAFITGTLINITDRAKPIKAVSVRSWPDHVEVHILGENNKPQLIVWALKLVDMVDALQLQTASAT